MVALSYVSFFNRLSQARKKPVSRRMNLATELCRGRGPSPKEAITRRASGRSHRHRQPNKRLPRSTRPSSSSGPATKAAAIVRAMTAFEFMKKGDRALQRVWSGVSSHAWERIPAHATKYKSFTIPWGSPREAMNGPLGRPSPAW